MTKKHCKIRAERVAAGATSITGCYCRSAVCGGACTLPKPLQRPNNPPATEKTQDLEKKKTAKPPRSRPAPRERRACKKLLKTSKTDVVKNRLTSPRPASSDYPRLKINTQRPAPSDPHLQAKVERWSFAPTAPLSPPPNPSDKGGYRGSMWIAGAYRLGVTLQGERRGEARCDPMRCDPMRCATRCGSGFSLRYSKKKRASIATS